MFSGERFLESTASFALPETFRTVDILQVGMAISESCSVKEGLQETPQPPAENCHSGRERFLVASKWRQNMSERPCVMLLKSTAQQGKADGKACLCFAATAKM